MCLKLRVEKDVTPLRLKILCKELDIISMSQDEGINLGLTFNVRNTTQTLGSQNI